jgi:hypothetical protein
MTQWASQLIPAGSVVVGGLVTGSLTLWGQALVNKGTHKREREARHDSFKVKQREIERDALLALQEALRKHINLYIRSKALDRPYPDELLERHGQLISTMIMLATRIPEEVEKAVTSYNTIVSKAVAGSAVMARFEVTNALGKAQRLAGEALMRPL